MRPEFAKSLAKNYTARGWCVTPLNGKRPFIDKWQKSRINTPELVDAHFRPHHNVGVILGQPSGWLVDIDLDHPLAVKVAGDFLPPTEAIFGRKSNPDCHWLYCCPLAKTVQLEIPDVGMIVELRSTGGQTMAPGSIHPSGEPVEWSVDGAPTAIGFKTLHGQVVKLHKAVASMLGVKLPDKKRFAKVVGNPNAKPPANIDKRVTSYLATVPGAVSGNRGHRDTFKLAQKLVRGFNLSDDVAFAYLTQWNEKCQPPWNERQLWHKVRQARTKGQEPFGALLSNGKGPAESPPPAPNPTAHSSANFTERKVKP